MTEPTHELSDGEVVAAQDALDRLDRYCRLQEFEGVDPYDGLSSPLARLLRFKVGRQALVQLNRRSLVNLRPLLRISPKSMAVARAWFLSGYARAHLQGASETSRTLTDSLLEASTPSGWGYEFDVQTRWGYYPSGTPNIIATAFAIEALTDVEASIGHLQAGVVSTFAPPTLSYVIYVPGNNTLIHNANVLGARALLRLGLGGEIVAQKLASTLERQQPDGSWPYGESARLEWVDAFHTAYVLDALDDLRGEVPATEDGLRRGLSYWLETCFTGAGVPTYFAHEDGSTSDLTTLATCLETLHRFRREDERCVRYRSATLRALLAKQRPDGAFVRSPRSTASMRWDQAPVFKALASLCGTGGVP